MISALGVCPYIGLRPYTEKDRRFFFGRERDEKIIASNLYGSRLTILYGASGVGKSSLLQAGITHHIRKKRAEGNPRELGTAVIYFNQWENTSFLQRLKQECQKGIQHVHETPLRAAPSLPLDEFLKASSSEFKGSILIILDQFEEYLLYPSLGNQRDAFDTELARAVNRRDVTATFLLGIREDSIARLDEHFRLRIPNLLGNTLKLEHLGLEDARRAIIEPLRVYREEVPHEGPIQIDEAAVIEILEQVRADNPLFAETFGQGTLPDEKRSDRVDTTFLQLVLLYLWEQEKEIGNAEITTEALERSQGAGNIASTYVDRTLSDFSAEEQEMCSRMFLFLVTPSGTKIPQRLTDLAVHAECSIDEARPVLTKMAQPPSMLLQRLSRPERYQIRHDRLALAVLDWRNRFEAEKKKQEIVAQSLRQQEEATNRLRQARLIRRLSLITGAALLMALLASLYGLSMRGKQVKTLQQITELSSPNKTLSDREAAARLWAETTQALKEALQQRASATSAEVPEEPSDNGQPEEVFRRELSRAARSAQSEAVVTDKLLQASSKELSAAQLVSQEPAKAEEFLQEASKIRKEVLETAPALQPPPTRTFRSIQVDQLPDEIEFFEYYMTRTITSVHLHHTWKPDHKSFQTYGGEPLMQSMFRYHTEVMGWRDIAPHIVIDPAGMIWMGREWNLPPVSASEHNGTAQQGPFMIDMIGNFDAGFDRLEGPQHESLLKATTLILKNFGLGTKDLFFHSQLTPSKTCPGTGIDHEEVIREVENRLASP